MNSFFRLEKLIASLVSKLRIEEQEQSVISELTASQLTADGSQPCRIHYVLRRPSCLKTALLKQFCRNHDLPIPNCCSMHKRSIQEEPRAASIVSLRNRTGHELTLRQTRRYRETLQAKLDKAHSQTHNSIYVPVSFHAGRGPSPWPGPLNLPVDFSFLPLADLWLLLVFWVHKKHLKLGLGPTLKISPQPSGQVLARHSGAGIIRALARILNSHERVTRGVRKQRSETIEGIVLSGKQYETVVDRVSIQSATSRWQTYSQGQQILREISGTMRAPVVALLRTCVAPVLNRVFDEIRIVGIDKFRKEYSQHPLVLLPSHRSHFDYLVLSTVLYQSHLPLPYIAAGVNLNFFPVGWFFRSAGAFFIRRRIENNLLYKTILQRYLTYLIKHGHMIEFYIEGGRTRTGFTLAPRMGLLKVLVRCLQGRERYDLRMMPISISYERVPDTGALSKERSGGEKKKESIFQLLKLHSLLNKRFGSVIITIGTPISLRSLSEAPLSKPSNSRNKVSLLTEDLAFTAIRNIQANTALTGTSILCTALFSLPKNAASEQQIASQMHLLLKLLATLHSEPPLPPTASSDEAARRLKQLLDDTSFCSVPVSSRVSHAINALPSKEGLLSFLHSGLNSGLAMRLGSEAGDCGIAPDKVLEVDYYRNTILHLFLLPCVAALASAAEEIDFDAYVSELHQVFKPLFLLPPLESWLQEINTAVSRLEAAGLLSRSSSERRLALSETGTAELQPAVALFLPYIESLSRALTLLQSKFCQECSNQAFLQRLADTLRDPFLCRGNLPSTLTMPFVQAYIQRKGLRHQKNNSDRNGILTESHLELDRLQAFFEQRMRDIRRHFMQ